jgi:sugar/nucleoside kinase (ribokinase family)
MSIRVVCVGDLMVDVHAQLPGPLAIGSDTPASIRFLGGGAAANVAAWCVAAQAAATFVGRVGDDPLGRQAVNELRAAGVDVRAELDADRPTGTCIVLVDPASERTMVPSAGANGAPVDAGQLPADADWLYLSGYTLLRAASRPSALDALERARGRGWSIAVDAASAAPLAAVGAEAFLGWLGSGIVLFANEDEARLLTEPADPGASARALARRVGQAVVKLGAGGAVWSDGAAVQFAPAVSVPVLDTTGAGDAFAAGYLTGTGAGPARISRAVQLAARAVATVGARPDAAIRT